MARKTAKAKGKISSFSVTGISITQLSGKDEWQATWGFNHTNCSGYKITWTFWNAAGQAWTSDGGTATQGNASVSVSDTTIRTMAVTITPICSGQDTTKNRKNKKYWKGAAASASIQLPASFYTPKPSNPSAPSLTIDSTGNWVASLEYHDVNATSIIIQVYNAAYAYIGGIELGINNSANIYKWSGSAAPGNGYTVRAIAKNSVHWSEWSSYASIVYAKPAQPSKPVLKALEDKTSVSVSWGKSAGADSYTVEYTNKKEYFDNASVSSTTATDTDVIVPGLEAGHQWFFRVKATNSTGDSPWSEIEQIVIATKPSPPTTYSNLSTCFIGDTIEFYWVHNSEDASKMQKAEISVEVKQGATVVSKDTYSVTDKDTEGNVVTKYTYSTSNFSDSVTIRWMVRTWGIAADGSDWSITREIKVWRKVSVAISGFPVIMESYPLAFSIRSDGGVSQTPIGYHIQFIANRDYEAMNKIGEMEKIHKGDAIFDRYDESTVNPLEVSLSPGELALESLSVMLTDEKESYTKDYTVKITVSLSSGLSASTSFDFSVVFDQTQTLYPDMNFGASGDGLSLKIIPYCTTKPLPEPEETDDEYDDDLAFAPIAPEPHENEATDALISVYRFEDNGTNFTPIVENYKNDGITTFVDPHPYFGHSVYRVVATDPKTGRMFYEDRYSDEVDEDFILIQWGEEVGIKQYNGMADLDAPDSPTGGYQLKLRWNVDVNDTTNPDQTNILYIGRKFPVSYFGTQIGESGNWSSEIPLFDDEDESDEAEEAREALQLVRRLSMWMGNCYVREPSGLGFWATVKVSYDINHLENTIPVKLSITRVEGDV